MARCSACHRRIAEGTPCPQDGWAPPRHRSSELSSVEAPEISGFVLGEPLGAGGFSTVWAATHEKDGSPVALKVGRLNNALAGERFRRDAAALARVGPPFVPRLVDQGQLPDGRPYIAMELLRGKTLAARLEELLTPPDLGWVVDTAGAVLATLEVVHQKGVIHRDLKPENIIFTEDRSDAVLIDFGLTKSSGAQEESGATRRGAIVGTPEYMAPEQLRGDTGNDPRTDIYAFGVMLFEMLTLRLPFVGERGAIEHGHLTLRPPRPRDFVNIPQEMEDLTLACLAKEPERRPPDATSIRLALSWASSLSPASSTPTTLPPTTSPRSSQLLTEGRLPAVVLVTDTGRATVDAIGIVTARKGFVARQKANRLVCVFSGMDTDDPVQSAAAAAREIGERLGGRAALHLAALTIRRKGHGPPSVYGAPVDQPDAWLPPWPWDGIVLTSEIARVLPESEVVRVLSDDDALVGAGTPTAAVRVLATPTSAAVRPQAHGEGASAESAAPREPDDRVTFFRLARSTSLIVTREARAVPLLGRDEVIAAIAESMEATFKSGSPALFTLLGDHGLGKSRLAGEAATLARCIDPSALVITIRSAQPVAGAASQTIKELLARALGVHEKDPPDDPRGLCMARLGGEVGADVWRSVAAVLGWKTGQETHTPAWSLRHGAMRALAEALRLRAHDGPVAVILDDAHWTDEVTLDALEYATLDGAQSPLWVLVTAHPKFEDMRRNWGSRTHRHTRTELGPLAEPAGMKLAAELLLPAEYTPDATLRQIAGWAGGNPSCLAELIRMLRRAGIVQKRPAGSWYVATAELDRMPPLPAWQWLAARRLDALSPELAACVRLCAVLGQEISREEVERIQDAIEQAGEAGTPIDAGVGLSALVESGILERTGLGWYTFQSATFRDAVYELLASSHRAQIHRHAFEWWRAQARRSAGDRRTLEHLARHAGACGEREQALEAYLALGEAARTGHQLVEADQQYTSALAFADPGDLRRRALALGGRGKVRYSVYRIREALDDLSAARELARELGDDALTADLLLEEATALDHAADFGASEQRVEEARPLVERLAISDPALGNRFLTAQGRSYYRHQRVTEAIELLQRAAEGAETHRDPDTRVIALLILSSALVLGGRLVEAEARFHEVISLCSEIKDRLHLCSAYANRAFLWTAQSSPERGMEDLRRAVQLAREVGNPEPEHVATHNLAELLHWSGQENAALGLARRARVLEERFVERAVPYDALLLARIQVARGEHREAAQLLAWITTHCPPDESDPTARALYRMLEFVLASEDARRLTEDSVLPDWDSLLAYAEGNLPTEERLEVLYWRVRAAVEQERLPEAASAIERSKPLLYECPMWKPRFDELMGQVPAETRQLPSANAEVA